MWVGSGRNSLCASANEELGTLADNNPLTLSYAFLSLLSLVLIPFFFFFSFSFLCCFPFLHALPPSPSSSPSLLIARVRLFISQVDGLGGGSVRREMRAVELTVGCGKNCVLLQVS